MIDKSKLLTSFINTKSFHLGKGMHSYISSQDISATYDGNKSPEEILKFMEYLSSDSIAIAKRVDKSKLKQEYIQIPEYQIASDEFYTNDSLIQKYLLSTS